MYVVLSYVFFNMSGTLFSKTPKMYLKENASSRSAVGRGEGNARQGRWNRGGQGGGQLPPNLNDS